MPITIRPLRDDECGVYLDTLNRSIRGLASSHYPPEVIEHWVVPVTEKSVTSLQENSDREIRLVAELWWWRTPNSAPATWLRKQRGTDAGPR
jgi:hypothetical protein